MTEKVTSGRAVPLSDEVLVQAASEKALCERPESLALHEEVLRRGPVVVAQVAAALAPEVAWELGRRLRCDLSDAACSVTPYFEAALASTDPTLVAMAHQDLGYGYFVGDQRARAEVHLRVAMASGLDDEPMESALWLGYVLDDPIQIRRCFRVALGHEDREHRGEAALAYARSCVANSPTLAATMARYAWSIGAAEDRAAAAELLTSLGEAPPGTHDESSLPNEPVLPPDTNDR